MRTAGHTAVPVPREGEIFRDARGAGRTLRISRHAEAGVVVLSLWRSNVCVGTFRLPADEVPDLVEVLRGGLHASYDALHGDLPRDLPRDLPGDHPGGPGPDPLRFASEI